MSIGQPGQRLPSSTVCWTFDVIRAIDRPTSQIINRPTPVFTGVNGNGQILGTECATKHIGWKEESAYSKDSFEGDAMDDVRNGNREKRKMLYRKFTTRQGSRQPTTAQTSQCCGKPIPRWKREKFKLWTTISSLIATYKMTDGHKS